MSTWMVVEDEPDIYEVLLAMFEMWGIEGVAFVDGEEALAWIDDVDNGRFRGELPELALVDVRLPGSVDGAGVSARLRKSPILGEMSIVLNTAYRLTLEQEVQMIERAGADKLMYKPLPKFNELQTTLEEVIAKRHAMIAKKAVARANDAKPKTTPAAKSTKSKTRTTRTRSTTRTKRTKK